jgi:hypothetical protein
MCLAFRQTANRVMREHQNKKGFLNTDDAERTGYGGFFPLKFVYRVQKKLEFFQLSANPG